MSEPHEKDEHALTPAQSPVYLVDPNQTTPWLPLPDESSLWYDRFNAYRQLGPARTLLEAYRTWAVEYEQRTPDEVAKLRATPGYWYEMAARYQWEARALAWDVHLWSNLWETEEQARLQSKQERIYALTRLMGKSLEVIEKVRPAKESLGAAGAAIKTAIRELRAEYEGSSRHDRLDIAVVVADLPAQAQKDLRSKLKLT